MNKLKFLIYTALLWFALQMVFAISAKAQLPTDSLTGDGGSGETGLSTGSFSNGAFNFPAGGLGDIGGLAGGGGGLGDLLPGALGELFRDIALAVGQVETFLSDIGLEVDFGRLGLPDIEAAVAIFEEVEDLDIYSDVLGTRTGSTAIIDDVLRGQYLRDLANEYALNTTLSQEGQEFTAEQQAVSEDLALASEELAQDSEQQDVSQNILRNISAQMAIQQVSQDIDFYSRNEEKIGRSLTISMQAESLTALKESNTAEERLRNTSLKTAGDYQGLVSIPGQHLVPPSSP